MISNIKQDESYRLEKWTREEARPLDVQPPDVQPPDVQSPDFQPPDIQLPDRWSMLIQH